MEGGWARPWRAFNTWLWELGLVGGRVPICCRRGFRGQVRAREKGKRWLTRRNATLLREERTRKAQKRELQVES